jgi:hypothetical protein
MFYYNLGGISGSNLTGNQTVDGVNLTNIKCFYWSGTELDINYAWYIPFSSGLQDSNFLKSNNIAAWVVHSGDIGAVPAPAAIWLFGSGLMGLIGVARCKT